MILGAYIYVQRINSIKYLSEKPTFDKNFFNKIKKEGSL